MQRLTPRNTSREYYIYIMISETPTKFGKVLRHVGGITYNHASIAFDAQLRQLYSFGRRQSGNPLGAGLVKEHVERFTLRKKTFVNVRIYRLSVTKEQYLKGKQRLLQIKHDSDGYLYNLLSVLSYPIFHGFETYKAYTCAEFVANMLRDMGVDRETNRPCCEYKPEDIGRSVDAELIFEGNLLDYCTYRPKDAGKFFETIKRRQVAKTSCSVTMRLIYRKLRYKNKAVSF